MLVPGEHLFCVIKARDAHVLSGIAVFREVLASRARHVFEEVQSGFFFGLFEQVMYGGHRRSRGLFLVSPEKQPLHALCIEAVPHVFDRQGAR